MMITYDNDILIYDNTNINNNDVLLLKMNQVCGAACL